ncbi:MAG: lipoyl(octanoyl) transferase LipB, partial [Candidatus Acidoferrales bacterium]
MAAERRICGLLEWGLVPYARACAWQKELVGRRRAGEIPDLLILCHHPPVITLGRSAQREHLRLPEAELGRRGVEVQESDRGGDVTFHGPGQLVGYPIVDLSSLKKDVVWYLRSLEEVLIRATKDFGVDAARKTASEGLPRHGRGKRPFYTGVWVGSPESGEEKLAAIGVHISRWITSHGFAYNVTTDLSYFDLIVPCGISDKRVTSLARLLAQSQMQIPRFARDDKSIMEAAKRAVVKHFGEVFGREMQPVEPETWEVWVGAQ